MQRQNACEYALGQAHLIHLTEPEPRRGEAAEIQPGIRRIVAKNPGPMTYHGTNTYLVDSDEGVIVIDPGPADEAHLGHVLAATAGRVAHILLTHAHSDHVGNVAALRAATGAPVGALAAKGAPAFVPDHALRDGAATGGLTVIHTPGHAPDHLCFARADGVLFSGDHVMGWSSTMVSPPPSGDMTAYLASLALLLARADRRYLPGHGPPIDDPHPRVDALLRHRLARERDIETVLRDRPSSAPEIVGLVYALRDPGLRRAAERSVLAHLAKLEAEGRAVGDGGIWRLA